MKFKLPTLAAAAALLANCSAPVMADMPFISTVGPWKLTADAELCAAEAPYSNGTSLTFMLNTKGGASIGILQPNWKIPDGTYQVTVRVDRAESVRLNAKAGDGYLVFFYNLNEPSLNLLSYGRTMFVTVGRESYQYDLVRSEAMLKALGQCVAERMPSTNPFAGQPPQASAPLANPFPETASNPYRRM